MKHENFVDLFLEYHRLAESPTSYFKWSAYVTLATILRDNVWVATRDNIVFPNLYVIILSKKSSTTRKSIPMNLTLKLIQHVDNTHIIQGRATMQGIIRKLNDAHRTENGTLYHGASGFLFSEELTSFFHRDIDTIDILTTWHDFHSRWDNTLASADIIPSLENVCITMFGATNEELIGSLYDASANKGGLLARTVIVRESRRRKMSSFLDFTGIDPGKLLDEKNMIEAKLKDHVTKASKLKGPFTLTPEALDEFNKWYYTLTDDKIGDFGVEARIQSNVLKVSMALSVAQGFSLKIDGQHMRRAIKECTTLLSNYKLIVPNSNGPAPIKRQGALVLQQLMMAPNTELTREQLLQVLWEEMDQEILERVITTFASAGFLKDETRGNASYIKLLPKAIDMYKKAEEQK